MFMRFFTQLREAKVPVTLKEYLMLMEAMDKEVIDRTVEDFYFLSRSALVKDEKNLDKFDRIFGSVFKGLEKIDDDHTSEIPSEWLRLLTEKFLTDEEKAEIEALGGFDKLMEQLAEQMKRQREETGNQDYPLYVETDVERVEHALAAVPLANPRVIGRGGEEVALTMHLAGHVAGAVGCLIEHRRKKHFFTGDVHFQAQRTVAGANFPRTPVDTLVMECTRGATTTVPDFKRGREEQRLIKAINEVCDEGGSVLLPAFAFGRMQEILLLLQEAADAGNLADVPIFCSGLGMDLCDYLDAASKKTKQVKFSRQVLRDLGILPLSRKYTQPGKNMPERGIYLLSSGMLVEKTPAWRVAANMLDHEENAVFFVGYCDPETPGGELIGMNPGGEFKFKSLDHTSTLRAKVERFHLSGHADREELVDFAKALAPKDIVLTHGDPDHAGGLADFPTAAVHLSAEEHAAVAQALEHATAAELLQVDDREQRLREGTRPLEHVVIGLGGRRDHRLRLRHVAGRQADGCDRAGQPHRQYAQSRCGQFWPDPAGNGYTKPHRLPPNQAR